MSPTATKVLNIARSQLGYVQGRGQTNKFGRWFGMDRVSWCDEFISWVAVTAGARDIIGRAAYCPAHAAWFQSIHRWGHEPRRGAIVFFDWPGDNVHRVQHIGIVESVLRGNRIVTIEGNTSDGAGSTGGGVHRRVRALNLVAGFGYPDYGNEKHVRPFKPTAQGTRPPLTIDGQWGRNTTRAVQRWVGVPDDGAIGDSTRKGLQAKLGIHPDGNWGRSTRKALQKALGVHADGDWGSTTIRALQHRLNSDWRR